MIIIFDFKKWKESIANSFKRLNEKVTGKKDKKEVIKTEYKIMDKIDFIIAKLKKPFREREKKKDDKLTDKVTKIIEEIKEKNRILEKENKRLKIINVKRNSELSGLEAEIIEVRQQTKRDQEIIMKHEFNTFAESQKTTYGIDKTYWVFGTFRVERGGSELDYAEIIDHYDTYENALNMFKDKIDKWDSLFESFDSQNNYEEGKKYIYVEGHIFLREQIENSELYNIIDSMEWSN